MIIHFVPDSLYSDIGVEQFRKFSNDENRCVVVGESRALTFIKTEVDFVDADSVARYVNSAKPIAVFIHKMTHSIYRQLPRIEREVLVIWIPWGQDYQELIHRNRVEERCLLHLTHSYVKSFHLGNQSVHMNCRIAISQFFRKISGYDWWRLKKGFKRVDIMLSGISTETRAILNANKWFTPYVMHWGYPHSEINILGTNTGLPDLGRDIMLGNSGSISNNHADGLEFLGRYVDVADRKIVAPLSYGSMNYRAWVENQGKKVFGDSFVPIREVLPREEYQSVMDSCSHAFFFNLRQEAVGNILVRLFRGVKVYMFKVNPLFEWLRGNGAKIANLEAIQSQQVIDGRRCVLTNLSSEDREINRKVVLNLWGKDLIDRSTQAILDRIEKA